MTAKSILVRCVLLGVGMIFMACVMIGAEPLDRVQPEGIHQFALELELDEGTKERWLGLQSALESSARGLLQDEGFTLETSPEARREGDPIVRISLGIVELEGCESSATALLRIQLLAQANVQRLATKILLGNQHVPVWKRTLHFGLPTEEPLPEIEMALRRYLLELSLDISSANRGSRQLEDFNKWKSSKPQEP